MLNAVEKFSVGQRLGLDFADSGIISVFLAVKDKTVRLFNAYEKRFNGNKKRV